MKNYYLIFLLVLSFQICYPQNVDSIINILEGKWEWYETYKGGFLGGHITPEEAGYNMTIEFIGLHSDSVSFYLYKNDTLVENIVTTIFPIDTAHSLWAIDKNIVPVFDKYFIIFFPWSDDYLYLWLNDSNHIEFSEPSTPESPAHLFKRKISNSAQDIDNEYLVNVYPNPFSNKVYLKFNTPKFNECKISIYDCNLRCMCDEIVVYPSDYFVHSIENLDSFPTGIYFIRIFIDEKIFIRKIIKL